MKKDNKTQLVKVKFFIPQRLKFVQNKLNAVNVIFNAIEKADWIKFAGFLDKKSLKENISNLLGDNLPTSINYFNVNATSLKDKIEIDILSAVKKCQKILSLPAENLPIYMLIFPWFPESKKTDEQFGGVNAYAPYYRTMHLFINLKTFTKKSIKETIAHEWNHLAYYNAHPNKQYSVLDRIIMEGLAEIFREEKFNGKPSAWSTALNKEESEAELKKIKTNLSSKSFKVYEDIAYGRGKFKKWTGYSIGYLLVKSFRQKHKNMSWKELISIPAEEFLLTY
jgi:uncharacterized protein YjaZ